MDKNNELVLVADQIISVEQTIKNIKKNTVGRKDGGKGRGYLYKRVK